MSDNERAEEDDWGSEELESVLDDSGAELDALLDEMDSSQDTAEEDGAGELAADEGASGGDEGDDSFDELMSLPEVDDELDLSSGDEPETKESADDSAEPVPSETESREKNMSSDPLAEVAAIAAERNAEASKHKVSMGGRGSQLALAGLALLALALAGISAWLGYSASMRIEELATTVQRLPSTTPPAANDSVLRGDLEKLMAQVNEMTATLDGSLVELRDNNKSALDELGQRLEKLETIAAKQTLAAKKAEDAAKTPPVQPATAKQPTEKVTAVAPTARPNGGWSVNLISLSNEKEADKELARLRNLGLRADKQRVEQDGRVWFRLRVPGFTSRDGARAYIKTVENKAGINNAWVGKD